MHYDDVAIPLGHAWSSPFARWQGSLAEVSSIDLVVGVTRRALGDRQVDPSEFDGLVLGWTVPQPETFYGAPTVAARIGAGGVTGPMVSQACATSVASLHAAAAALQAGAGAQLVLATDRTSNGPQLVYPSPSRPGGAPISENWVLDNFARDPWAGASMLACGEAVARDHGFTREEVDELTLLRYEQYTQALADDRAFQRRYMVPVELPRKRGAPMIVDADEGVRPVMGDTIAKLSPVQPEGVHTFASQTHPADGCAGAVLAHSSRARELSGGQGVARLLATGFARVTASRMPEAPLPAAEKALAAAGLSLSRVDAITTHNPFAVNDLYLAAQTGIDPKRMNTYGCSLIFGHPQGPTGLRSIAELIEQLRIRGGGIGLFTGCAAGDTGAALVVEVAD